MSNHCKTCDRCLKKQRDGGRFELFSELKTSYRLKGIRWLCQSCSEQADSFINYYGEKKREDLHRLSTFLKQSYVYESDLFSLLNAGYSLIQQRRGRC